MRLASAALLALASPGPVFAADGSDGSVNGFKDALTGGTPSVFLRVRSEIVESEALDHHAIANTARIAIGYTTKAYKDVTAGIQFEAVEDLFGSSKISNPVEPYPARPTVLDFPANEELQQAWISYAPGAVPGLAVKAGRQEIAFDNQRFVGPVGWRQDWQTFDAGRLDWKGGKDTPLAGVEATYAYLSNVYRIFPDAVPAGDLRLDSHLLNLSWTACTQAKLTGYAYLLDYDLTASTAGGGFTDTSDSQTLGLRLAGTWAVADPVSLMYAGEYAQQSAYAENGSDLSATYTLLEAGVGWHALSLKLGYEILGGDLTGTEGTFTTPLATLHAFNGWADLFLATPASGLVDFYVAVGGGVPMAKGLKVLVVWHDFSADDTSGTVDHLGNEIDLLVEYALGFFDPRLVLGAKYAAYTADDGKDVAIPGTTTLNVDTEKLWVYAQYAF